MPYTKNEYPNTMKNLDVKVRNKAIEILNALLKKENMDESRAIPISISQAKDWAKKHPEQTGETADGNNPSGKNVFVLPREDGWAVKSEKAEKPAYVMNKKAEAIKKGREMAKNNEAQLIVHGKEGGVQAKYAYNR